MQQRCQQQNATRKYFSCTPFCSRANVRHMKKQVKSEVVGIRFYEPLLTRIRRAANEDRRKVSEFVRVTLEKVLAEKKAS